MASNKTENGYLADVSSKTDKPEAKSEITLTPRSRCKTKKREVGLSPQKFKTIKRKLVIANVVINSMTPTTKQKKQKYDFNT